MIERGVIMSDGQVIEREHLPLTFSHLSDEIRPLQEIEKEYISTALRRFQGNISRTAKALQIPRSTLRDKIRDLEIQYKP
jgi:DNA-binding NtrC family response regulator